MTQTLPEEICLHGNDKTICLQCWELTGFKGAGIYEVSPSKQEPLKQEIRLCRDCWHIGTNSSGDWMKYRCFAPENKNGINLVTGENQFKLEFCNDARLNERACGFTAKWFLPRPAKIEVPSESPFTPQSLDALADAAKKRVQAIKDKNKNKWDNL